MTTVNTVAEHNATIIVDHIRDRNLPKAVAVIAIMTAITESGIRILANPYDPESMQYPHDGIGYDHDSAGIYQQRPGWGPVSVRMDIVGSTDLFLNVLLSHNWSQETPWLAAQHVQISYDSTGENYHRNYDTAVALVDGLWIPIWEGTEDMANIIARKSNGLIYAFESGYAHRILDTESLQAYINSKQYYVANLTDQEIDRRISDCLK